MSPRGWMKPRTYGSLTSAVAALVEACGGLEAVHRITKLSTAVIARYTDPQFPDRNMSAETVLQLEKHCGKPIVTEHMAAQHGGIFDPVAHASSEPMAIVLGRVTQEFGQLLSAAAVDASHDRLTAANASVVLRETDDVMRALAQLRAMARVCLAEGGAA